MVSTLVQEIPFTCTAMTERGSFAYGGGTCARKTALQDVKQYVDPANEDAYSINLECDGCLDENSARTFAIGSGICRARGSVKLYGTIVQIPEESPTSAQLPETRASGLPVLG